MKKRIIAMALAFVLVFANVPLAFANVFDNLVTENNENLVGWYNVTIQDGITFSIDVLALDDDVQNLAGGDILKFVVIDASDDRLNYNFEGAADGNWRYYDWQSITLTSSHDYSVTKSDLEADTEYFFILAYDDARENFASGKFKTDKEDATKLAKAPSATPSITGQPSGGAVTVEDNKTLSVTATGSGTLSYQWQYSADGVADYANITNGAVTNGGTISGATTDSLTITGYKDANKGRYKCVVTNTEAGKAPTPLDSDAVELTTIKIDQAKPTFSLPSGDNLKFGVSGQSVTGVTGGESTGAYTYHSSDATVATINETSGALTYVKPGSTNITVKKAGDVNYNDVESATVVLKVEKGDLTISGVKAENVDPGTQWKDVALTGTVVNASGQTIDGGTFAITNKTAENEAENATDVAWRYTPSVANQDYYNGKTGTGATVTVKDLQPNTVTINGGDEAVNKTYGDERFKLNLTANSSSGAITWESGATDVATVDNNGNVTILKQGAAIITANVAADGTYAAASDTITLNVAKKKVTLKANTFAITDKPYDNTAAATFTGADAITIEGLMEADNGITLNVAGLSAVYDSVNKGSDIPVKITGIVLANDTDSNYEITAAVDGNQLAGITGNITAAKVSGTLPEISKVYDGSDVIETEDVAAIKAVVLTGVVGGQDVTLDPTNVKYAGAGVDTNALTGTWALSGAGAVNYELAANQPVTGTVKITARPLTVEAKEKADDVKTGSILYGHQFLQAAAATPLTEWDKLKDMFSNPLKFNDFNEDGVKVEFYDSQGVVTTELPSKAGTYKYAVTVKVNAAFGNYDLAALAPGVGPDYDGTITIKKSSGGSSGSSGGGSSAVINYTVTYNAGENGTLAGEKTEKVGKDKTPATPPKVTAKEGYRFLGWSTDGKTVVDPTNVKITKNTTFTALYEKTGAIDHKAYINGMGNNLFAPNGNMTRAEAVTMLDRLHPGFEDKAHENKFNDVNTEDWFANYVAYGANNGIVEGYQDGSFQPNATITRGEFAAMLSRFAGLTAEGSTQYADVNGHWAEGNIAALQTKGIVGGYEDGSFRPNQTITRAEAVKMINGAISRTPDKAKIEASLQYYTNPFSDVTESHWAYYEILEAAIDHYSGDFH